MVRRWGDESHARGGMSRLCHPRIHLRSRQVTALARLRALSHLDLNLLGADQISAGDAETSRRHLLDGGTFVKAVRSDGQTLQVFSALTGVGFAVNLVHGDGQRLMG